MATQGFGFKSDMLLYHLILPIDNKGYILQHEIVSNVIKKYTFVLQACGHKCMDLEDKVQPLTLYCNIHI